MGVEDIVGGSLGLATLFVFALIAVGVGVFDKTMWLHNKLFLVLGGIGMIVGGVFLSIGLSKLS